MYKQTELPSPIRFNPFKHHRGYLLQVLEHSSERQIIDLLTPFCNNWVDVYTGALGPEAICRTVVESLRSQERLHFDDFIRWIGENKGYASLCLEDGSRWVVRKGDDPERYIHLHPARNGPLTVRYKGSTLKTIWLLRIALGDGARSLTTDSVNKIRQQVGLTPVKRLERNSGIVRCYRQFFE